MGHCLIHGTFFGAFCPSCNRASLPATPPAPPLDPAPALIRIAAALERIATALEGAS